MTTWIRRVAILCGALATTAVLVGCGEQMRGGRTLANELLERYEDDVEYEIEVEHRANGNVGRVLLTGARFDDISEEELRREARTVAEITREHLDLIGGSDSVFVALRAVPYEGATEVEWQGAYGFGAGDL